MLNHLVPKNEMDRWTDIFFSFSQVLSHVQGGQNQAEAEDFQVVDPTEQLKDGAEGGVTESGDKNQATFVSYEDQDQIQRDYRRNSSQQPQSIVSQRSLSLVGEGTFWEWFKSIFTLKDEDIEDMYGEDALQYLRFQRYIIGMRNLSFAFFSAQIVLI